MIALEAFNETDFDRLIAWIGSEEELVQFAGPLFSFPITRAQLQMYIEDSKRYAFKLVLLPEKKVVGHAEIFLHDDNAAVLCRILIGDPLMRGKGLGLQTVQQLLHIAFTHLQVETVSLNVFDWNMAAIRCYEKAGFVFNPSGTKRREVNGKQWMALNMKIDRTNWSRSPAGGAQR